MVSLREILEGVYIFIVVLYFGGVFVPLAPVGYEMIIANSYQTRLVGYLLSHIQLALRFVDYLLIESSEDVHESFENEVELLQTWLMNHACPQNG